MKNMFSLRSSSVIFEATTFSELSLGKPKTTTYGLISFSYFSAKQWNALPDSTFFVLVFLQILRPKYGVLPGLCRFFMLSYSYI